MINPNATLADLQEGCKNTMIEHLGIEYTEIGTDYICAKMPVDHRTFQPMKLLHGGASVALAETLGSVGSLLCIDTNNYMPVGIEINANHIRSATSGYVTGRATLIHLGQQTHIWEIRITDDRGKLVCISRITIAIIKRKA